MKPCLICEHPIEPFISFGQMPIANGFLAPEDYPREFFFELKVAYCPQCHMVQLAELVDREKMFHEHYAFFSSTSQRMAVHFQELAESVRKKYLTAKDPFVVEIGSNDGITLRHFAAAGIRHLGIEPSANVAEAARGKGVNTVCRFFDEAAAEEIRSQSGPADVILASNVMCHIPYLHSVVEGIRKLLKPGGVLMFEDPYLGDIVAKTAYDQIYDEHAFYFSLASIRYLFRQHGLEVVDVIPQNVHGGSMRYVIAHENSRPVSPAVEKLDKKEAKQGLRKPETYEKLRRNIERSRVELMELIDDLRRKGKSIVGYAATSKSTTVINYCGMTPAHLDYISDTTPIKQGKFSPGAHIPVLPYENFTQKYPDYALLFAWNHAEEVMAKEKKFVEAGGKWIVYVPKVAVQ